MAPHDQRLVEQVCDHLGLPPGHILPPTLLNANLTPLPMPCEPLAPDQIANIPSSQVALEMETLSSRTGPFEQSQLGSQAFIDFTTSDAWEASPSDWSWQILNGFSTWPSMNCPQRSGSFAAHPIAGADQDNDGPRNDGIGSSGTSDDEAEVDIVPSLAARLGGLRPVEDGRLRFYGTASNHHLLGNSSFHPSGLDVQEMQRSAAIALHTSQLDQEVPSSIQEHFMNLFFSWHNPCHTTVDRALLTTKLAQNPDTQTEYSSPSLIAAM